jgi:hypothetical protein
MNTSSVVFSPKRIIAGVCRLSEPIHDAIALNQPLIKLDGAHVRVGSLSKEENGG